MSEEFNYNYSAEEKAEIQAIKNRYTRAENEADGLKELKQLDAAVTRPGLIVSLTAGVVGTLVFGLGLSCVTVWNMMFSGIIIGLVGLVGIAAAYPLYSHITEKQYEKLGPRIVDLAGKLEDKP